VDYQLGYSQLLGRKIRLGSAAELSMSTPELALDALRAGRRAEARDYLEYEIVEVGTMLEYLSGWLAGMLEIARGEVAGFDSEVERLTRIIGRAAPISETTWSVGGRAVEKARLALDRGDTAAFERAFATLVEEQIVVLDAQTDWSWGILTVLRDALGEERLGEILRDAQGHVVDRYQGFDMPVDDLVALTVEGMRALHTGPDRNGRIDVVEEEDRWVLSFDPCGSGGRMRRGDAKRGQPPRTESPFEFGVTNDAHDWSWNERGVCLYCAHCAVAGEIMPIERNGFPMRVTEHPRDAHGVCRFTIYKSPELVPDWVYERIGKTPPPRVER
jgi:hypothetical protein